MKFKGLVFCSQDRFCEHDDGTFSDVFEILVHTKDQEKLLKIKGDMHCTLEFKTKKKKAKSS
jgi:predicted aminopeptidase